MEISLKNVIDWLVKSLAFILVITIVFGLGGFLYTKYFVAPSYTASVKFYASGTEESTQYQMSHYQSVAHQYIEFLNINEFYDMVSRDLLEETGTEISPKAISSRIGFSSIIEETSSFFVIVTANDPNLTYSIAQSVARKAPEQIESFQQVGALEVVSNPVMPSAPSGPNLAKNTILSLAFGLVLSAAIVILREMLDNRIKSADEISELFGLPVFGVIPDFSAGDKKGVQ